MPRENILLYPCGNLKRETLAKELESSTIIKLDSVTCYKTSAHRQLETSIKSLSETINCLDMVIFFSPSGVKFCWDILQKYFYKMFPRCIAIGPTTMDALRTYCTKEQMIYESNAPSAIGIQNIVSQIIKEM